MVVNRDGNLRWIRRSLLRAWRLALDFVVDVFLWLTVKHQVGKMPPIKDPTLLLSAGELARRIRTQEITSESAVEAYIVRIRHVEPLVNAVVDQRFELALKEAREVDSWIRTSGKSYDEIEKEKPFLGVPLSIKGNIGCKDLLLDSGMFDREGILAEKDAEIVKRMREAGAIPLVLTNLPEMAMAFSCHNWIHGSTCNPFDLALTSGGSSGGEAALLTSAGSLIGIGNDLLGSLRIPASLNGIFAHKPTGGIIPWEGMYPPIEDTLKEMVCNGPMCRYAKDLKPFLKILTQCSHNKLQLDKKVDLSKLKIYFNDEDMDHPLVPRVNPEVKIAVKKAVKHFQEKQGVAPIKFTLSQLAHSCWIFATLTNGNMKRKLRSYLTDNTKEELDVIPEFLKSIPGLSKHTFFAMLFCVMEMFVPEKGSELFSAYQSMHDKAKKMMSSLLDEKDAVWIIPSFPMPGIHHLQTITQYHILNYFAMFNVLGLPVTQVPMGRSKDGLPLGIQVVAGKHNDHLSIAVAEELEKAFGGWVSPSKIVKSAS